MIAEAAHKERVSLAESLKRLRVTSVWAAHLVGVAPGPQLPNERMRVSTPSKKR
jgi:hypothetical protein